MNFGRPWSLRRSLGLLLLALATSALSSTAQDDSSTTAPPLVDAVAKNVTLSMGCPEFLMAYYLANVSSTTPYRKFTVTKGSGYAYFQLHFTQFWLPPGCSMVLRGVENVDKQDPLVNISQTLYSGYEWRDNYSTPIHAKELQVELYREVGPALASSDTNVLSGVNAEAVNPENCYGFVIDSYDYELDDPELSIAASTEATCANDNTKEAFCYYPDSTTRPAFLAARTVARLLIRKEDKKTAACTGWLLGSEGHLMTNFHCVETQAEAKSITVEFMAEAKSCNQNCKEWGDCPGTVESISSRLVWSNETLDYALLKLDSGVNLPKKYGFLRLKPSSGRVNQAIYIPQHPLFYGKRLAMINDYGTKTTILDTAATGCNATGYSYNGDTQGGSSGSPVIDAQDHGVVALHHCGQMCSNTGIPSVDILADLKRAGVLPKSAEDTGEIPNTDNFPFFQPEAEPAPLPFIYEATFARQIIRTDVEAEWANTNESYKWRVSVDRYFFSLPEDARISVDVLAYEVSNDGKYEDVNGDCAATYVDPVMYLFKQKPTDSMAANESLLVAVSDDAKTGEGMLDGSVSTRDPFMETFLKKGDYFIAIGAMPLKSEPAFAGESFLTYAPEIYTCGTYDSVGSYRVKVKSSGEITFPEELRLANMTSPGDCAAQVCKF